mgnify:CR=1 FL=1
MLQLIDLGLYRGFVDIPVLQNGQFIPRDYDNEETDDFEVRIKPHLKDRQAFQVKNVDALIIGWLICPDF